MRQIEVRSKTALSRTYRFSEPVRTCGYKFTSIEACYFACFFAQHNCYHESFQITTIPQLIEDPSSIRDYVLSLMNTRCIPTSPQWTMNSCEVMHTVLLHLLRIGGSEFSQEMQRIRDLYGYDVAFIATGHGSCRVWNSGYHPGQVPSSDTETSPGNNLYGWMLRGAYTAWIKETDSVYSLRNLLMKLTIPIPMYRKTVAVISDSMFRHVKRVDGGDIFVQGGVTCGELAKLLQQAYVDLTAYNVVILCVGTNDSNYDSRGDWSQSYERLRLLLTPLRGHPVTRVIINTGIGVPGWRNIRSYTRWFIRRFNEDLQCENFFVLNWSIPSPTNPFIDSDGRPNRFFLHNDEKHPNLHGLRKMRFQWGLEVPNLACVAVDFSTEIYPVGNIRDKIRALSNQ